jgi:hypothetical protein
MNSGSPEVSSLHSEFEVGRFIDIADKSKETRRLNSLLLLVV